MRLVPSRKRPSPFVVLTPLPISLRRQPSRSSHTRDPAGQRACGGAPRSVSPRPREVQRRAGLPRCRDRSQGVRASPRVDPEDRNRRGDSRSESCAAGRERLGGVGGSCGMAGALQTFSSARTSLGLGRSLSISGCTLATEAAPACRRWERQPRLRGRNPAGRAVRRPAGAAVMSGPAAARVLRDAQCG